MSKAVSKAPDSGQVTSAPTQPALPADGRGRPRPRENPKTVCATGGAGSGDGPKTVLARGRLGNLPPPPPSSTRHRREGEKRDLTALELRSYVRRLGHGGGGGMDGILRGQWELGTKERDGG